MSGTSSAIIPSFRRVLLDHHRHRPWVRARSGVFPRRATAVNVYPGAIDQELLQELDAVAATGTNPYTIPRNRRRMVVTGFSHYMHTLWNELPALDRAISAGLADKIALALPYQPLGPITELFPEFARNARPLPFDRALALNRRERLLIGLGSTTISRATQARVRAVANRHAARETLIQRDLFRVAHRPVFWLSVKPPGRTLIDQADFLARLIKALRAEYPHIGFILDGTSVPWDAERNPNYGSWFGSGLARATDASRQIIRGVLDRLNSALHDSIQILLGAPVCDEIVWAEAADFYFCHGGTMQNKIGWIHHTPGMIHSSKPFLHGFQARAGSVENGPPCYILPANLSVDCETESVSAFGVERREQNYAFPEPENVIREILQVFSKSLSAPAAGRDSAAARHPRARMAGGS